MNVIRGVTYTINALVAVLRRAAAREQARTEAALQGANALIQAANEHRRNAASGRDLADRMASLVAPKE